MNQSETAMADHISNPAYGDGCYRRRIRLHAAAGVLSGQLEDDCHGFTVTLEHDGQCVTAVSAQALRIPMSTCPGAVEPLQQLIGLPLAMPAREIVERVSPRSNCTHLYDLALLTMAHSSHPQTERIYDITVHDMPRDGGNAVARVALDDVTVHEWQLQWTTIAAPAELAGRPVLNGFAAWANDAFSGIEQEAAFALSKGVFVGLARMYDLNQVAGQGALQDESRLGVCYSYSHGVVEKAIRLKDSVRDFTATPENLLKFV